MSMSFARCLTARRLGFLVFVVLALSLHDAGVDAKKKKKRKKKPTQDTTVTTKTFFDLEVLPAVLAIP